MSADDAPNGPRVAPAHVDLALVGLGGLGLVRLLLAIAQASVLWATTLQGDATTPTGRATLELWRALTTRGLQLADAGSALALVALARAAEGRRFDRGLALAGAVAAALGSIVAAGPAPEPPALLTLAAALAPLALGLWLLRDALRLRRPGLVTASLLLLLSAAATVLLPFIAGLLSATVPLLTSVRLGAAWTLSRHLLYALVAAVPLVLVLRRRAARRPAEPALPLADPRWGHLPIALGTLRQVFILKASIVGLTLAWAVVLDASPALPGPGMLAATGSALALGSLWTLAAARRWLTSPARGPAPLALALVLLVALVAEVALAWAGARPTADAHVADALRALSGALVVTLGANAAAALLLILSLHRLSAALGVARSARTLTRVGLLGVVALLVPWAAWIGRGLDALLDPWAIGAVLVALVGLVAALTVLALVMDDLELRLRRGREAAGVASRFS